MVLEVVEGLGNVVEADDGVGRPHVAGAEQLVDGCDVILGAAVGTVDPRLLADDVDRAQRDLMVPMPTTTTRPSRRIAARALAVVVPNPAKSTITS